MTAPCDRAWTIEAALRWARQALAETTEPAYAARALLAHTLRCPPVTLVSRPARALTAAQCAAYRALVERRAAHYPLAYLIGHRPFYDVDLVVDPRVLIPRPETEHLVERVLALARRWPRPHLVDVGTGSGAIAIALAKHLPHARLTAIDVSADALQVAAENARRHGVGGRIAFLHGDLLAPLADPVHLIAANLPYVSDDEYAALPAQIRRYEPRQALVGGPDGLDPIRTLLRTAPPHLIPGGAMALEIGAAQGPAVTRLARQAFPAAQIDLAPDYAGLDRVVLVDTERQPQTQEPLCRSS